MQAIFQHPVVVNEEKKVGGIKMDLLFSHWHCILPVFIIILAMIFMRDKKKDDISSPTTDNSNGMESRAEH